MDEQMDRPEQTMCKKHGVPKTRWKSRKTRKNGGNWVCKACTSETHARHRRKDPTKSMFVVKKARAKQRGIEFSLVFEDMVFPTHCPVLGIELDYSVGNKGRGCKKLALPSFDRIDPTKGYTTGNVIIVSMRANIIKTNANPDEILAVGNFYKALETMT